MPRHVLTLNDLGEEGSWLLVQQARGIPDAKSRTDFMTERTAVLLFAQDSFAERLCVSAAVRQMGGSLVFQGATGGWKSEVERYQRQMLAVIDYFVDCMYVYGIPGLATSVDRDLVQFPIINAGSPDAHPAHVLADVACMLRYTRDDLKKARVGWLGCTNGTLFSLIEALQPAGGPAAAGGSSHAGDLCPSLRCEGGLCGYAPAGRGRLQLRLCRLPFGTG